MSVATELLQTELYEQKIDNGKVRGVNTLLYAQVEALEAELTHWKANHADQVQRNRLFIERLDMPVERVKAYEQLTSLLADIETMRNKNNELNDQVARLLEASEKLTEQAAHSGKNMLAQFNKVKALEAELIKAQVFERFAGYLLDNCEGQTVYEESLQQWLSDMLQKEKVNGIVVKPELYECIGKGGSYKLLGESTGSGTQRGQVLKVYRDVESGRLFHRFLDDWSDRMQLKSVIA